VTRFAAVVASACVLGACSSAPRAAQHGGHYLDAGRVLDTAAAKYLASAASLDVTHGQPRSTDASGAWRVTSVNEWTSGFFPGTLWYLHKHTKDERLRAQAVRWTLPLADIPAGTFSHDLGFQFNSSFVNAYRFTGEERFRVPALNAARLLANRFNPAVGAIKSWDWMPANRPFPVIVDNMMNLELLFWGARQPDGDPGWRNIAVQHAHTTLRHHVRPDHSSFHVVVFDPRTGGVLEKITHQGYADSTTWSRGQAWLIYGFTMVYRETGDEVFLAAAQRAADYFIARVPGLEVPCWDFQAPDCPRTAPRDASAGAIAASGLIELSAYVDDTAEMRYRTAAGRMLIALSSAPQCAPTDASAALLPHAVGNHPAGTEIDVGLSYADYYFVEALLRWNGDARPLPAPRVFTTRTELLRYSKETLPRDHPALIALVRAADSLKTVGPFTVTSKTRVPPSGDKRDYVSYGPYWWPDTTRPGGLPYVRRDGVVNTELRRESDVLRWYAMVDAVETLAHAYYFTDREEYAARAALLLRTWFVDSATRMNPHLQYGQAIPGVTEGRGIGIIDTRDIGRLTDAISIIDLSPSWRAPDQKAIDAWMRAYLDWLLTSEHGRDEADEMNNHGTWYDVQVVALALFTGDTALARRTAEDSRTRRIGPQIDSAGRQPLELARTRSLHYSVENLEAMTRLAEMARAVGVDLWNWHDTDNAGISEAIRFVAPYADPAKRWPGAQITAEAPDLFVPLLQRARHASRDTMAAVHLSAIPRSVTAAHRTVLLYPAARRYPCDSECRIVTQIIQNGRRTAWQQDYKFLDTEATAITLSELTTIERPDMRTRNAVHGAAAWLLESALHGLGAGPRWAKAYGVDGDTRWLETASNTPIRALADYSNWARRTALPSAQTATGYSAVVDVRFTGEEGALIEGVRRFRTIARALQFADRERNATYRIRIRNGRYREKLSVEIANVHFIGESRDSTVLTFDAAAGHRSPTGGTYGTRGSYTLRVAAPGFRLENMTVENGFDYMSNYAKPAGDTTRLAGSQGVAVMLDMGSDFASFENCNLSGHQDTLFPNAGRSYFHRCAISGSVDFIFGAGTAVFEDVDIISRDRGSKSNNGYITAPSTAATQPYGFVIINSRLKKESSAMAPRTVSLGRPWRPGSDPDVQASAVFINTWMDDHITGDGWTFMNSTDAAGKITRNEPGDARFFEFNSTGPGATTDPERRLLSSAAAAEYTVAKILSGWR
jgi:pectin methylesterase-like acyl-CoA thioesterase